MTDPIIGGVECKLHAYRKTQAGTVVSFLIHPEDKHESLANADLGTPLKLAYQSLDYDNPQTAHSNSVVSHETENTGHKPVTKPPGTPYHERPASWQAGLRCADPEFRKWLFGKISGIWVAERSQLTDEQLAAEWVREQCDVASRGYLNTSETAKAAWQALDAQFQQDTNRMAEERS